MPPKVQSSGKATSSQRVGETEPPKVLETQKPAVRSLIGSSSRPDFPTTRRDRAGYSPPTQRAQPVPHEGSGHQRTQPALSLDMSALDLHIGKTHEASDQRTQPAFSRNISGLDLQTSKITTPPRQAALVQHDPAAPVAPHRPHPVLANDARLVKETALLMQGQVLSHSPNLIRTSYGSDPSKPLHVKLADNLVLDLNMYFEEQLQDLIEGKTWARESIQKAVNFIHSKLPFESLALRSGNDPRSLRDDQWKATLQHLKDLAPQIDVAAHVERPGWHSDAELGKLKDQAKDALKERLGDLRNS